MSLSWTFLEVQGVRICLPIQRTQVQYLGQEDFTCCEATKCMSHSCWMHALQLRSHNYRACTLRPLKPTSLEPVFLNERRHFSLEPGKARAKQQRPSTGEKLTNSCFKSKSVFYQVLKVTQIHSVHQTTLWEMLEHRHFRNQQIKMDWNGWI